MDKKWWICHALSNAPAKWTSWWQFLDPDQIWCLISCLPTDGVDSMFMNHKVTSWVTKWVTHSVSCSLRGSPTQVIARLVSALAGTLACVYKEHTTSVTHFCFKTRNKTRVLINNEESWKKRYLKEGTWRFWNENEIKGKIDIDRRYMTKEEGWRKYLKINKLATLPVNWGEWTI